MDYSIKKKEIFRTSVPYEDEVLLPKIRTLSEWRDTDPLLFQSGVYTLALFLPEVLFEDAIKFYNEKNPKKDLTKDGKKDYDDFLVYILRLLEHSGMCFPKVKYHEGIL